MNLFYGRRPKVFVLNTGRPCRWDSSINTRNDKPIIGVKNILPTGLDAPDGFVGANPFRFTVQDLRHLRRVREIRFLRSVPTGGYWIPDFGRAAGSGRSTESQSVNDRRHRCLLYDSVRAVKYDVRKPNDMETG